MCEFSIKPDESCRRHRRDGTRSDCILLYKEGDVGQLSRLMITPPARKLSKKDEALLDEVRVFSLYVHATSHKSLFSPAGRCASSAPT